MKKIYIILILIVSFLSFSKATKKKKEEDKFIPIFAKNDEKSKKSLVYNLKNKESKKILKILNIYDDVKISGIENKIIIYGPTSKVIDLIKIIKSLDTIKSQVYIKVKILDVSHNLIERLGINWNKKSKKSISSYLKNNMYKYKKYKDRGEIKLKILPSVLVLNFEEANLKISTLKMKLKPKIKGEFNNMYVELNVDINFNNEYIKTVVNIKDGKSLFISSNKIFQNQSFVYKASNKELRDVYIEIEVKIL